MERIQNKTVRQMACQDNNQMHRYNHVYYENKVNCDMPMIGSLFELNGSLCNFKIILNVIKVPEFKDRFVVEEGTDFERRNPAVFQDCWILPKYALKDPIVRLTKSVN